MEIITGALYAESGHTATALKSTKLKATKRPEEMNWAELLQALTDACDKEIASNNATKNS